MPLHPLKTPACLLSNRERDRGREHGIIIGRGTLARPTTTGARRQTGGGVGRSAARVRSARSEGCDATLGWSAIEQRQKMQRGFFPQGLVFDGEGFGTAV